VRGECLNWRTECPSVFGKSSGKCWENLSQWARSNTVRDLVQEKAKLAGTENGIGS
jgi:hypothetical protein